MLADAPLGRHTQPVTKRFELPVIKPLRDTFSRQIHYLRVSLTDRCNFRCVYCMPAEGITLAPRAEVLRIEEIERLVRIGASMGVTRVRLTGGEPTIRKGIVELVARLSALQGIKDVVMTTNGVMLSKLAEPLASAGLSGVNISIDTLRPERFFKLTRRNELERVIEGIDAARDAKLHIKLNVVALRDANADEISDLCRFAWSKGAVPRFIEHMPLSEGQLYASANMLGAAEIRQTIENEIGELQLVENKARNQGPARYWTVGSPGKKVGIISAMTEHFCDTCNRVRLSATGQLHTCLAFDDATDLRALLREGASDDSIRGAIRLALEGKKQGHLFHTSGQGGPSKHMVSIGG